MTHEVLLAVGVIVVSAHLGGVVAARLGQPRVLGEMLAGIALGPSVLGAIWPDAVAAVLPAEVLPSLRPIADLGLVLFMFVVGFELDLEHLRGQGHRAVVISHTSIVVPFALGFGVGWLAHRTLGVGTDVVPFALFTGAAMAVTAFPVLARILQETGLARTRVGAMALACAAVDDITAWCVLAAVLAVAEGTDAMAVLATIGGALAFGLVTWFGLRPLLRRFDHVPLGLALALAIAGAWATEAIGVHAIFGAFLVGVAMPRDRGDRLVLVDRVEPVVAAVLLPVFFLRVGLSTEVAAIGTAAGWALAGVVLLVAVAGKLGGAGVAARVVGERWRDAWTIGVLMNTRGLTEIVILTVGLDAGVIGPPMFTAMVLMALLTTAMATPALRLLGVTHGLSGSSKTSRRDRATLGP